MLMEPLGHKPTLVRSTAAVLFGYLMNMVFPRAGEVTRCTVLQRTDRVPLAHGFGTVFLERAIDVVSMLLLFLISLFVEFSQLKDFFYNLFTDKISSLNHREIYTSRIVIFSVAFFLLCVIVFILFYRKIIRTTAYQKLLHFLSEIWKGVLSVRKLKSHNTFILLSIAIWTLYVLMTYVAFYALKETIGLTFAAGMVITAVGSMGMSAPVQGGFGVYHYLVANALIIYGLEYNSGLVFATIVHTTQFLLIVLGGVISVIYLSTQRRNDVPDGK